jgi:peptide subunit release factor 1 (eRF1)
MSNTKTNTETAKLMEKITQLSNVKGQTPSSMITLVIPPKYCI